MEIVGIIQARMGSSRLPGKVLSDILGKPMLELQIGRLRRAGRISRLVLATTESPADDPVAELGERLGLAIFRGSERDVLDRYYQAASEAHAVHVMRLTADCPLIDPEVCDRAAVEYEGLGCDYLRTGVSFAEGLDCEIISMQALEVSWREARLSSEREHVTLFVRNHPERFRIAVLENERDDSGVRITVDVPEDLAVVRAVFAAFAHDPFGVGIREVRDFLATHPQVAALNSRVVRNEGLAKSLTEDRGAS